MPQKKEGGELKKKKKKASKEGEEQKPGEIHTVKCIRAKRLNFYHVSTEYMVQVALFLQKDGEEDGLGSACDSSNYNLPPPLVGCICFGEMTKLNLSEPYCPHL